jgi:RNA polymerase sigma-70 factor (ECF subfamily)
MPIRGVLSHETMMNGADISSIDWKSDAAEGSGAVSHLDFEQAFAAHHRLVYRYAISLTRDAGLAEDVVQEVFVKLYQNLDAAQRDGLLRAWLLRVTANIGRNILRGRSRAQIRDESFAEHRSQVTKGGAPDESLLRRADIDEARRALSKLKEPLCSCLLLRNEGLSYKEIAATLDINETSVGATLARARREFARIFGKVGKS